MIAARAATGNCGSSIGTRRREVTGGEEGALIIDHGLPGPAGHLDESRPGDGGLVLVEAGSAGGESAASVV